MPEVAGSFRGKYLVFLYEGARYWNDTPVRSGDVLLIDWRKKTRKSKSQTHTAIDWDVIEITPVGSREVSTKQSFEPIGIHATTQPLPGDRQECAIHEGRCYMIAVKPHGICFHGYSPSRLSASASNSNGVRIRGNHLSQYHFPSIPAAKFFDLQYSQ